MNRPPRTPSAAADTALLGAAGGKASSLASADQPAAPAPARRGLLAAALAAGLAPGLLRAAAADVPATQQPVTLRFGWWGGGERHKRTLEACALFEARHPGVRIKAEYMGFNGYLEKLTMQMVGGTEADVVQINWAWLAMFSKTGDGFLDLNRHRSLLALDEFSAEDQALCTVKGKLNGLPPSYSARIFLWNAAAFERAGLSVPTSWDALFAAGPLFKQRLGERAFPIDGEIYDMLLLSQSLVHQRHGQAYLAPGQAQVAMGPEALRDWVATFRRLSNEHVATPLRYRASLGGADKPTEQQPDWVNGRWAGNYTWDSTIRLRQSTLDKQQRLALGPPLMLPGARSSGVFGRPAMLFSASRRTRHPEWAARFINFLLTDPDAARTLGLVRGLPSARSAQQVARQDKKLSPLELQAWQQINEQRQAGQIPLPSPLLEDARMRKFLRDTFERIAYDKLGEAEAAERLLTHGNALLKRLA